MVNNKKITSLLRRKQKEGVIHLGKKFKASKVKAIY